MLCLPCLGQLHGWTESPSNAEHQTVRRTELHHANKPGMWEVTEEEQRVTAVSLPGQHRAKLLRVGRCQFTFVQLWHTPLFMQHTVHNYAMEVTGVSFPFHLIHIN